MRIALYTLLVAGIFTFNGCGSDDDAAAMLSMDNIQGSWDLTAYSSDSDVTVLGETSNLTSEISNSSVVVSFAADGSWTSEGSYTITSMDADTTTVEMYDDGIGEGTYTVSSGSLTLVGLDAGDESDMESLTLNVAQFTEGSELRLNASVMETIMDPFFGLTITIDADIDMALER